MVTVARFLLGIHSQEAVVYQLNDRRLTDASF
jgi:hypothetical protein